MTKLSPIIDLLQQHHSNLTEEWLAEINRVWLRKYPNLISDEMLRRQFDVMIKELTNAFQAASGTEQLPEILESSPLGVFARNLSTDLAKKGIRPGDTVLYVITLKNILNQHLIQTLSNAADDLAVCLYAMDFVLDRLSLLTFDAYAEAREKVISQQSLSLLELSTPVVLLWSNVLMLPLVGVIDTLRARHFTERMLEAITAHEATVTIIDVTGVPVFDTSVARHIMKAIDAAQLLGSRIVMTGISPEGAQTLAKLNISFNNVSSRATLRAGVAEALKMVGRRVIAASGDK